MPCSTLAPASCDLGSPPTTPPVGETPTSLPIGLRGAGVIPVGVVRSGVGLPMQRHAGWNGRAAAKMLYAASEARCILCGAFDGEGYVIWRPVELPPPDDELLGG